MRACKSEHGMFSSANVCAAARLQIQVLGYVYNIYINYVKKNVKVKKNNGKDGVFIIHIYLCIYSDQDTEKSHQKMLFELVPEKNIGINALSSIYTYYWLPKLTKNQINRVAFLMRTSTHTYLCVCVCKYNTS